MGEDAPRIGLVREPDGNGASVKLVQMVCEIWNGDDSSEGKGLWGGGSVGGPGANYGLVGTVLGNVVVLEGGVEHGRVPEV